MNGFSGEENSGFFYHARRFWHKYLSRPSVSVIIPAYNECKTIRKVIEIVKKNKWVDELIVVDDGSKDETAEEARKAGAIVFSHSKNRGKGAAIKTGIEKSKGQILCFVDADLKDLNPKAVDLLVEPLAFNEADIVKGDFERAAGRVTQLVANPLMKHLFGETIRQPLSGQFSARRKILEKMPIANDYGVDVGILLDATKKGARLKEVFIGKIEHRHKTWIGLVPMAEQVSKTILEKAGVLGKNRKIIVFDLDKTLIADDSLEVIAKEWGFEAELLELNGRLQKGELKEFELSQAIARHFNGKKTEDLALILQKMRLQKNAEKVVKKLKTSGYRLAIVSHSFEPIVAFFAQKLGIESFRCPKLQIKRKAFTGRISFSKTGKKSCSFHGAMQCKAVILGRILKEANAGASESIAVGDSIEDECMLKKAGLGIAFNAERNIAKKADVQISDLSELLLYV
ncbi:MAG: HAD-IB family phosphatase [Candidatus Diapherotrites archaeon]